MKKQSEIVLYQSTDGCIKVDVLLENETVWLNQSQIGELYGRSKSTISEHISAVFQEGELQRDSVVRNFRTTAKDGKSYLVAHYNLDAIIAIGYRVKSPRGTQFRIWATSHLKEYLVKGFTINDERLSSGESMQYFRELLDRIRAIRVSERVFYQQIKDIYKTSVDYTPEHEDVQTRRFFKEVQNKLLWAVSGKTAAELVYYRANATLPQMGLTTTKSLHKVLKSDTHVAKNYLQEDELAMLKLIVEQYLAYAEAQALAHKPMYMKDWSERLSMLLTMNDKNILTHAGRISHELAINKANKEYELYKEQQKQLSNLESIKELDRDMKMLTINQTSKK